jgi:hypothetical protein
MFLDAIPKQPLIDLADQLAVAVVVETAPGEFQLRSPSSDPALARLFGSAYDRA